VTFGGKNPAKCCIILKGNKPGWIEKLTYLGCQFFLAIRVKLSTNIRKFYGGLNNIISVLGEKRNEISYVHLVKTYCVPSLLYVCKVWNLSCAEYRHLNVVWNNTFRKNNCCWRESARQMLFHCEVLPMAYLVDQQTVMFYKKLQRSEISC